jgi:hypothetical protein
MKRIELGARTLSVDVREMLFEWLQAKPEEEYLEFCAELGRVFHKQSKHDWGEVSDEDKALNDEAVVEGNRVLGAHTLSNGVKVWIITEADRSSTMILLPEEY